MPHLFALLSLILVLCPVRASSGDNCLDVAEYYARVYSTFQTTSSPDQLQAILRGRISAPHNSLPYTDSDRTDVWDAMELLDGASSSTVLEVYTRSPEDKTNKDAWNREHLWPKSRGVGKTGSDFTDIHHLRASDVDVNRERSSLNFGYCPGCPVGHPKAPKTKKDVLQDRFEAPDEVKGDIARAVFYMAARYSHLVVTDNPVGPNDLGYLSDLIQWHINDPVSAEEQVRNDKACSLQLNRNPFVDFPCLVGQIYGGTAGCGATAPPGGGGFGTASLLFSKYVEGVASQRAVQVTNRGTAAAPLAAVKIRITFNGVIGRERNIELKSSIALNPDDTLVICSPQFRNQDVVCDLVSDELLFNGNDVVALVEGGATLDTVGQLDNFEICNERFATQDHTLIRELFVTTGNRGVWNADSACKEWRVYDASVWSPRDPEHAHVGDDEFPVATTTAVAIGAVALALGAVVFVAKRRSKRQLDLARTTPVGEAPLAVVVLKEGVPEVVVKSEEGMRYAAPPRDTTHPEMGVVI